MKSSLRSILKGETRHINHKTLNALKTRELVDENGQLTLTGWHQAVAISTLPVQCANLGISLEKIVGLNYKGSPEKAAWKHFCEIGFIGTYCEAGAILILIRAAALDVLAQLNTFGSREDACRRFTEAQLKILENRIEVVASAIESARLEAVLTGFREIYSSGFVSEWYPGLNEENMAALFKSIGPIRLRQIAEVIAKIPINTVPAGPILRLRMVKVCCGPK